MIRVILYLILVSIFVIIINLLKYNANFKGLNYESSFFEVISYVCVSFIGSGYMGIHPITKIGKFVIMGLSLIRFIIINDVLLYESEYVEHIDIYKGVKQILTLNE